MESEVLNHIYPGIMIPTKWCSLPSADELHAPSLYFMGSLWSRYQSTALKVIERLVHCYFYVKVSCILNMNETNLPVQYS